MTHYSHAKSLGFKHPITQEYLFFDSDLAADMQQVLDKWERFIANRELEGELWASIRTGSVYLLTKCGLQKNLTVQKISRNFFELSEVSINF